MIDQAPGAGTIPRLAMEVLDRLARIHVVPPLAPLARVRREQRQLFHRKLVLDFEIDDPFEATLATQISILRDMASALPDGGPIEQIVLWAGQDSPVLPDAEGGDEPWPNPAGPSATTPTSSAATRIRPARGDDRCSDEATGVNSASAANDSAAP